VTCTAWTPHGHHGTSRGARGLRQGAGGAPWGPGDLLMSFLGVVILHFGFRIHAQRRLMMRHGPEILGSTAASALFSLFATAAAARAAGLAPGARRGPPAASSPTRAIAGPARADRVTVGHQVGRCDADTSCGALALLGCCVCLRPCKPCRHSVPVQRVRASGSTAMARPQR